MADNTIALQTMIPKFDTPYELESGAQKIQQMRQATQQGVYQQQQQAQAQQDDQSYRAALQANPNGGAGLLSSLAGSGNYKGHAAAVKADQDARKGNADIDKTKADTLKSQQETASHQFEIAGQMAGAWANNPGVTKQQILAGLNAAAHSGVISPEIAQAKLDEVSQLGEDPRVLNGWAKNTLMQITKAKDQHDLTTVDANTAARVAQDEKASQRTNDRIAKEGQLNRANQLAVQDRMTTRQSERLSAPGAEPSLTPATLKRMAEMELSGDKSARTGLGRGAQGAANLTALQNMITDLGAERGISARDITAASAGLEGLRTGMRATGNISARVENAVEEAAQLAPLALNASRNVVRSGLLPFGKLQDMFDVNSNNPALADFATKNEGLVTAYASAMARGGKATVDDKIHARKLLTTAKDQPAYEATVNAMLTEMDAAKRAPRNVRDSLKEEINGKSGQSAPPIAAGWTVKEH